MAGRFSVEAVFKAIDRVTAPVSRMQNRVGKFTRSMDRGFRKLNRTVDKFGRGLKRGAQVASVSLLLVGGAMADVINTGAEFEQTLVNAAAKFPGEIRRGTEAFQALEDAARRTGSTTEFTASQSAQALNFLAMAGFDAEASIAALPGVVDLATAAQIDLATASDIATDSLGAFNLLSKDAVQNQKNLSRVSDVFAKATTRANLSIEQMFEAIKDGAPVGVAAGQSLETIATFAAKMADAGIKGTRAGTGLKNIFLALNAPGSKAAQVMRRLGIQTADADGNIRDAIDVFQDFSREVGKLPQQTQLQVFNEIFGKIPIAAAINLTNAADKMKDFRGELEAASGTSAEMAGVMRDTLQGRLNSLKSAVEGVKISIFSLNNGPLAEVIENTTAWIRENEKLIATNIGEFFAKMIEGLVFIAKHGSSILNVTKWVLGLIIVLKTLAAILTVVNLVMAANPVVLIVLGVMALIAAIAALIIWWDDLVDAFMKGGQTMDLIVAGIGVLLGPIGMLAAAAALVIKHWDPIKEFFVDLWDGIVSAFETALGFITGIVDQVVVKATAIIDRVRSIGSGVASFFGFDDDEAEDRARSAAVVSPQERTARQIDEQRTTSTAEVTLRDETGRAEVTGGRLGAGVTLEPSGAF